MALRSSVISHEDSIISLMPVSSLLEIRTAIMLGDIMILSPQGSPHLSMPDRRSGSSGL